MVHQQSSGTTGREGQYQEVQGVLVQCKQVSVEGWAQMPIPEFKLTCAKEMNDKAGKLVLGYYLHMCIDFFTAMGADNILATKNAQRKNTFKKRMCGRKKLRP